MKRNQQAAKQPEELIKYKNWYELKVDGMVLGVLWPSKQTEEEVARLRGLTGIEILPASPEKLIEVNAKTSIPARLFNRWQREYKRYCKSGSQK